MGFGAVRWSGVSVVRLVGRDHLTILAPKAARVVLERLPPFYQPQHLKINMCLLLILIGSTVHCTNLVFPGEDQLSLWYLEILRLPQHH